MIPVLIVRHPKERLSKCSLEPLRQRDDLLFRRATDHFRFDATGFILLAVDAPVLSKADTELNQGEESLLRDRLLEAGFNQDRLQQTNRLERPLLLLDSTWRLLPQLEEKIHGEPICRSLPEGISTAYPRVSKIAEDPTAGLASVEALYLARKMLGDDDPSLLENYHWREEFLQTLARADA
ncbi:hypothetical protein [Rubellicoccus peritrichatus]|uniref:Uncharacterized protein n=1 Tax=Rubellicoccus peritrichatus TaxID=3080537 RepID=A0AAQ3L9U8_9BACT|nr:hypothetical protein [Puniceicoccus sp. CR14]WOO41990.1 hypothetical protein RZN69_02740 [Puniceicoccus sp. CR14]